MAAPARHACIGCTPRFCPRRHATALLQAAQAGKAVRSTGNPWWRYGGMAAGVVMAFGAGWLAMRQLAGKWAAARRHDLCIRLCWRTPFTHRKSVTRSRSRRKSRSTWCSGCPSDWTNRSRCLICQRKALIWWVGDCCQVRPGHAHSSCSRTPAGQRVTLYLGALDKAAAGMAGQETGFRFEPQAGIPSFYWVDQGFGYALAGQLPRAALMQLAQAVYRQL